MSPLGSGRVVLLDACVLIPIRLTTVLLWLAEAGLIEVLWSDPILEEVERNLPRVGIDRERASRRVAVMRRAFDPEALVTDFADLVPRMSCHPKDRHVLAAAVRGAATTLLTFNLKDFPTASTEGYGIEVLHPDSLLVSLLAERSTGVVEVLSRNIADRRRPPQTTHEFLAGLTPTVPSFAHLAADAVSDPQEQPWPTPMMVGVDDCEAAAAFGEPGDLTNPASVAAGWWACISDDPGTARAVTYDPSAWGDYGWAVDLLSGKALASKVVRAVDAPDEVAFMRFIPEVASSAQAFSPFVTTVTVLTLVRVKDGTWRVWGLGGGMPAARDVIGAREG